MTAHKKHLALCCIYTNFFSLWYSAYHAWCLLCMQKVLQRLEHQCLSLQSLFWVGFVVCCSWFGVVSP